MDQQLLGRVRGPRNEGGLPVAMLVAVAVVALLAGVAGWVIVGMSQPPVTEQVSTDVAVKF